MIEVARETGGEETKYRALYNTDTDISGAVTGANNCGTHQKIYFSQRFQNLMVLSITLILLKVRFL